MKYTHMPIFLSPPASPGLWPHIHVPQEAPLKKEWGREGGPQKPTSAHCSWEEPQMGSTVSLGCPHLSKAWLARATSVGARSPTDGVSKKLVRGKAKILNVLFSKVMEFPCSSHGRCLPSRDLSWYKRRMPFPWTWRLAWNLRRGWTRTWGRAVNSGLAGEFRSATHAGLSH